MSRTENTFLSAEWCDLIMLNYEIDPHLLTNYIPVGTTLDSFNGKTYVSVVGFRFRHTKLFGTVGVPFHSNFEEVNLRFYVRRRDGAENRRGVVFISEIVPRQAIATVARVVYGENYRCLPMRHKICIEGEKRIVAYQWQTCGEWCTLSARASSPHTLPLEGSLEQFITEHYWGYSAQPGRPSLEYRVSHAAWEVWSETTAKFEGDGSSLYGLEFGRILHRRPDSAFLAVGSPVIVFKGRKIL